MGSTRPRAGVVVVLLLAAATLVGCGDDGAGSTSSTAGGSDAVTIRDFAYEPARITVARGTALRFANRDSTPHTVTSIEAGAFESGSIGGGRSGEIVLEQAGSFPYYCLFHPFMKGTVVVE